MPTKPKVAPLKDATTHDFHEDVASCDITHAQIDRSIEVMLFIYHCLMLIAYIPPSFSSICMFRVWNV
jgi:hypothetical protein